MTEIPGEKSIFHQACAKGDLTHVQSIIGDVPETVEDDEMQALFIAAGHGHLGVVQYLVQNGYPWNSLDSHGKSAGEYAKDAGHDHVYAWFIEEGVRSERLFAMMRGMHMVPEFPDTNSLYLQQSLTYTSDRLLDEDGNAVMMDWERPIMHISVDWMVKGRSGLRVLNVGFGLGIMDKMLASHQPSAHHVIEAHPDVVAEIHKAVPNCVIHAGTWQSIAPTLVGVEQFDVIYFDTYAEYYDDLSAFHALAYRLLAPNGRYSFFHGGGATNAMFNLVYRNIATADLETLGFNVTWETVDLQPLGDDVWHDVRLKYYLLDHYHLPMAIKPAVISP